MAARRYILRAHDGADQTLFEMLERCESEFAATPFQRSGFLTSFYRNLPDNCSPLLVSVCERSTGRVAMLIPLLVRNASAIRYVEAADLGLSDYVAPVVADWFDPGPSDMQALWRELIRVLPSADIFSLKKMPGEIVRGRRNPLALLPDTMEMGISTKTLDLADPDCPKNYRLSGLYKDGMRQLRKLRQIGEVEFRLARTQDEALAQFDHLMAQRQARFEALGRQDDLSRGNFQQFYRQLISDGIGRGELLFGGLYLDGDCIATDLGLVRGDTHHGIFTTMKDGDLRRFSPGTIAFMLILDETLAHGIRYYDIGVGEFPYKARLSGREVPLFERHEALSLRGRLALADAGMRRAVRFGLLRYPALRAPAELIRQKLRQMRLWTASSAGLLDWPAFISIA